LSTNRKKTPPTTEAEVLENCRRRCCVCYSLNRDFKQKQGQIAHLDQDPTNSRFDNLCFLCQSHHDEYDTQRRQTKGLTKVEVKRYRDDLYKTVAEWCENTKAVDNLPIGHQIPTLKFAEKKSPSYKMTFRGLRIQEGQTALRLTDKKRLSSVSLEIHFREEVIGLRHTRFLLLTTSFSSGLVLQSIVCSSDDRDIAGFMNTLHNNLDIWILHGQPIEGDERNPIMQPRDAFLVYRTNDGKNRLIIETRTISEARLQIQFYCSKKLVDDLENYLNEVGFSSPLQK
jgi:hypothetical protein